MILLKATVLKNSLKAEKKWQWSNFKRTISSPHACAGIFQHMRVNHQPIVWKYAAFQIWKLLQGKLLLSVITGWTLGLRLDTKEKFEPLLPYNTIFASDNEHQTFFGKFSAFGEKLCGYKLSISVLVNENVLIGSPNLAKLQKIT